MYTKYIVIKSALSNILIGHSEMSSNSEFLQGIFIPEFPSLYLIQVVSTGLEPVTLKV